MLVFGGSTIAARVVETRETRRGFAPFARARRDVAPGVSAVAAEIARMALLALALARAGEAADRTVERGVNARAT
jgi:hypothetical protein